MTPEQMVALGATFAVYLRMFEDCIVYRPTAEHLHAYCRGLLSNLPRKSIEPIALACGTAVRTLQEFLRDHVWDHFRMRDQLQQRLARQPALRNRRAGHHWRDRRNVGRQERNQNAGGAAAILRSQR